MNNNKTKIIFPLDQHEEPKAIWKKFYEDTIKDDFDSLRFMGEEIKTLQRIRELFHDNKRIAELCKGILNELCEIAQLIKKDIENARTEIKKLG